VTIVLQPGSPKKQQLSRIELSRHIGQLELDCLIGRDGLAELNTLFGVGERIFQTGAANPAGLGADTDPAGVEARHHLLEALPMLAQ
jgi:hypothetical protein